jgi:cytosine/adenosine deaminase-related metal-dependent hydrolase
MIYLKNATYIDWKTLEFIKTHIIVGQGVEGIISFQSDNELPVYDKDCKIIDCTSKYVTKSFAVGHHHVYSALARGMGAPKKNPTNFIEILEYIWWNLDKCLDEEMIRYSALATAIACAKAGSTFVIDHHASPNFVRNSLQTIAEAFNEVGVSHLLCYEISDRDGLEIAEKGLEETDSYLQKNQGLVGLHASFTVGNETLNNAAEIMKKHDSGIHIHVAEDQADQEHCIKYHSKRVVDRLFDFGILNSSKTILGHCLQLTDEERDLIRKSKAWVVQNMESNLNNKVGYFSGRNLGERIMLGTDGMHSDMLQSAKASFIAGQNTDNIDYSSAYQRFRNVHGYLGNNHFSGDGDNNLVVLDYDSPTEFNSSNFLSHFLFGLNSNHIQHVISDGRLIVENRQITTIDENEILESSRKLSVKLWERMGKGR